MREAVLCTMHKVVLLVVAMSVVTAASRGSPTDRGAAYNVTSDDLPRDKLGDGTTRAGKRELYHVDVTEVGEPCMPHPLWRAEVDPDNYEFGCQEIQQMLQGTKTLVGNGRVRDVYFVEHEGRKVVVKTLRGATDLKSQRNALDRHNREVQTLDAMRGHPNIVGMLGVCDTTVVTEYYSASFQGVLFRNKQPLPIRRVVSMALDAARGLQALHELAFSIHVDMKPQQLLIDETGHVLLNDFNSARMMGVARDGTLCPVQSPKRRRPTVWPSPENYQGKPLTPAADVYSMGMIFFALMAGDLPYDGDLDRLETALRRGSRPEIDPSWHKGFMKVVQDMWGQDPQKRPPARRVVSRLQKIEEELMAEEALSERLGVE